MGIVSRCSGQGRRVTYHISNVKSQELRNPEGSGCTWCELRSKRYSWPNRGDGCFRYSSFDNVKYLLNNGANPNPINKKGVSLVEMVSKEIKTAKKAGSIMTNV